MATRKYKRASDGKFSSTGGGSKAGPTRKKRRRKSTNVRASSATIKKRIKSNKKSSGPTKIKQSDVRSARNSAAIDKLRKAGVKIPAGAKSKVDQLKKGQTVSVGGGVKIKRTADNRYVVIRPKKKGK